MRARGIRPIVYTEGLFPLAKLSPANATMVTSAPAVANAGFRLQPGQAQKTNNSGIYANISGEWLVRGIASQFECYASIVASTTSPTGTLNTWLPLSSTREWEITASSDTLFCDLSIMIRSIVRPTDIWTARVFLDVESA